MHIQGFRFNLRERIENEPPTPPPDQEDPFWREFGNDVREFLLHADPQKLQELSTLVKNVGSGLRQVWKLVRHLPERIMNHSAVKDDIDDKTRDNWLEWSERIGLVTGLTAAGGQALLGVTKLVRGFKQGHTSRQLDGLVDLATATTLALTVAGLGAARLVAAPIAAGFNVIRGAFNTVTGFKHNDERKELQGLLDMARAVGGIGRIFKNYSPLCQMMGIAFAPVAGGLQAGRGLYEVSVGLKNDDKKQVVRGLADVATAVGTTMAFASGVAVIPGVVLAVAANGLKVAYQVSPKFRGWVNRKLDKHEDKLVKLVERADKLTAPLRNGWRKVMSKIFKHIDPEGPRRFSAAQLADITRLLHVDGRYDEEEQQKLKATLEDAGQGKETPQPTDPVPESQRPGLVQELDTHAKAKDFVAFMIAVADYDHPITPEEEAYLRHLSTDVGLTPAEFEQLLKEQGELDKTKS